MIIAPNGADKVSSSAVKSKPELEDKPEPDEDPFESTLNMASVDVKNTSNSAVKSEPELEDKPEPETDPFSQTIRMPAHELEEVSATKKPTGSIRAKDSNPLAKNGQTHVT